MVVISSIFSAPAEGIILQTSATKLVINGQELGTATLYITENNVVWGGGSGIAGGPSPVISLLYSNISLHAVQRNPSPAFYIVVNHELKLPELNHESGEGDANDDDDFDADDQPVTQLKFIPPNEEDLQAMYTALNQGQVLNPDPADVIDEEPYMDGEEFDEGDDEFEDAEEANGTPEEAAAHLRQMRLENSNGVHYEDCEDAEIEE